MKPRMASAGGPPMASAALLRKTVEHARWHRMLGMWITDVDLEPLPHVADVRPLRPAKARDVWRAERSLLGSDARPLPDRLFTVESRSAADDAGCVAAWLAGRMVPASEWVVVGSQPDRAVLTRAETFVRQWQLFCRPVVDDVTIWPMSQGWAAAYHHEEELYFGRWRLD